MSRITYQDFYGSEVELIDFSVNDHNFTMVFYSLEEPGKKEHLDSYSDDYGFDIPINSYVVKFDRKENIVKFLSEEGADSDLFTRPSDEFSKIGFRELRILWMKIIETIVYHYSEKKPETYLALAHNNSLKNFYDYFIKKYIQDTQDMGFDVISNTGGGGLGYAIKTPRYKSM